MSLIQCHSTLTPFPQGSLKEALGQVYQRFKGRVMDGPAKKEMIRSVMDVYTTPPYDALNLWPATRDWLFKEGIPSNLFP